MPSINELFLPPGGNGDLFVALISEAAAQIAQTLADVGPFPLSEGSAHGSVLPSDVFSPMYVPSFAAMLAFGKDAVLGCVPVSSPLVAAHLHCPPLVTAIVAEVYIATLNQSMDSFDQSPTATTWELEVIARLLELVGLPPGGGGVFTSGGTESNLMALMAARSSRGNDTRRYVLCSDQAHFSIVQAARVLGLAAGDVVAIPTQRGRIDPQWVGRYIADRRASGTLPLALVATAGTTGLGVVDPLEDLLDIAREAGAWLHVDGAYGAGTLFSSHPPAWTRLLGATDSVSIDFHKMVMQTIPCAAFLVADSQSLDAFAHRAGYLNREADEDEGYVNLVSRSLKTTRRFDALKVIFTLAGLGRSGLAAIVDRLLMRTASAADLVRRSDSLDLFCQPDLTTIAFGPSRALGVARPDQGPLVTKVRQSLLRTGQAVIGEVVVDDTSLWKLTFVNPLGTDQDLADLINRVEQAVQAHLCAA